MNKATKTCLSLTCPCRTGGICTAGDDLPKIDRSEYLLGYETGLSTGSQRRATEIMEDLMEYSNIIECEDMRVQLNNYAKEKAISTSFNV